MKKADKPPKILLDLYDLGRICEVSVDYRQTGTDTGEVYVTLRSATKTMTAKWSTVRDFLDVSVSFDGIARLDRSARSRCDRWLDYVAQEKEDFAEYERLKKKFG